MRSREDTDRLRAELVVRRQGTPRNVARERALTELAAEAAGFLSSTPEGLQVGDDGGLRAFADGRAQPGGVRYDGRDFDREVQEELADAGNYLVWSLVPEYESVVAGESRASSDYARRMRALSAVVEAWHALRSPPT